MTTRFRVSLLVLASGGCSTNIPDFGIDVVRPSVVEVLPAENSIDVDRDATIRVVFSEPVDEATVTSDSLQVLRDGVAIEGTVATSATAATFTPTGWLDDLVSYEIQVATSVLDPAGLALSSPYASMFTTEDLQWEAPFAVSGTAGAFYGAAVGVDENGTVMLVWSDDVGAWSRRIVQGAPQPEQQISPGAFIAGGGVANDGTALTIWTKDVGGRADLFWTTWTATSGDWTTPSLLETDDTGFAATARLSVNGSGFAVAAWNQSDTLTPPYRLNAFARVFAPGSAWGTITPLETGSLTAEPPNVALGENGDSVVNWVQSNGVSARLWGSYYSPTDGWSTALIIETSGGVTYARPHIDGAGNGIVTWGGTKRGLNHYEPGIGWGSPHAVGAGLSPQGNTLAAALIEDGGGGFLAWDEQNAGNDEIRVASLSVDGLVGQPILVSSSQGSNAFAQQCGLDSEGRGVVVWAQDIQDRVSLVSARLRTDGSWGAPTALEADDIGEAYAIAFDIGPGGEAAVIYLRNDGVKDQLWVALLR